MEKSTSLHRPTGSPLEKLGVNRKRTGKEEASACSAQNDGVVTLGRPDRVGAPHKRLSFEMVFIVTGERVA